MKKYLSIIPILIAIGTAGCATDPFVPFDNDAAKNEIAREQAKKEAEQNAKNQVTVDDGVDNHFVILMEAGLELWQSDAIIRAAEEWTYASGHTITFSFAFNSFDPASYNPPWGTFSVGMVDDLGTNDGHHVLGRTAWWIIPGNPFPTKARIRFVPQSRDKFYLTALHELGHALGLDHSDDYNSIMQKFISDVGPHLQCIDQVDVCKIHMCIAPCTKEQITNDPNMLRK